MIQISHVIQIPGLLSSIHLLCGERECIPLRVWGLRPAKALSIVGGYRVAPSFRVVIVLPEAEEYEVKE